jgi:hypothetical protein
MINRGGVQYMKYVDKFLKWKCNSDIIKYVPNPTKELTEAMAVRNEVSKIVLHPDNKMYYPQKI